MIYLQLLLSYLKIGFFGFGGGYAMLSLIQNEIVVQRGWLTSEQLTDIIAISQVTPGPIAINSATYVGYAVTGTVWGAALATLAACIPSLTLMLAATKFYLRLRANRYVSGAMEGMKPMMIGMIMAAALLLLTPETFIDWKSWAILAAAFLASFKKVNPILIIVLSAVQGYCSICNGTDSNDTAMKDYRFSNNTAKRRYELDLEDGQIAMIEYYLAPGGEVALTHTEVPYDHAGQGVGSQIAFKALTDIREQGSKVIPQCGFVASYIRRHPEWQELVAVRERTY